MFKKLKTTITQLLTDAHLFQQVYEYEPAVLGGFPCATVSPVSSQSEDVTLATLGHPTQRVTYTFVIRIYYGLTNATGAEANEARQTAANEILTKTEQVVELLATHRRLDGACDRSRPVRTTIGETQREMVVKYSEITYEVEVTERYV